MAVAVAVGSLLAGRRDLDHHAAGPVGEQVVGGRAERALGGRGVRGPQVDDLGLAAASLLDHRQAGVTGADQPRLDLQPGLAAGQLGALEHAQSELLFLLQSGVERQLVGHSQHVHGLDGGILADELGRGPQRRRVDVGAEDRDDRRAVVELDEERRALAAGDPVVTGQVQSLAAAVQRVPAQAEDHPADADRTGPRRAARSPRSRPRTFRSRRPPRSSGCCDRGSGRSRASGRAARDRVP